MKCSAAILAAIMVVIVAGASARSLNGHLVTYPPPLGSVVTPTAPSSPPPSAPPSSDMGHGMVYYYEADLTGMGQVPSLATQTFGTAKVQFNTTHAHITIEVMSGVEIWAGHLHLCAADCNGPVQLTVFSFIDPVNEGLQFLSSCTQFSTSVMVNLAEFPELGQQIISGDIYVNVHSQANPSGEIRGQLAAGPENVFSYEAELTGMGQVPALTSNTFGSASVQWNTTHANITIEVMFGMDIWAGHIHNCASDCNGPVELTVFSFVDPVNEGLQFLSSCTSFSTTVTVDLAEFPEIIQQITSGNAYVNVHSKANPGGEIRGQLMHS
ncbi:hypothetical protein FOA52_005839 [Chlamydomonas sp. UWO 241]|nr:hypothetical protein FOA52_005839 [Chlamydomonas sp. UWO 241]